MTARTYRHLLVPTDGSAVAAKGVKAAVKLARTLGARLRGVYVRPVNAALLYGAADAYAPGLIEGFDADLRARAKKALAAVEKAAQAAGVPCSVEAVDGHQPGKTIAEVARRRRCDLIVIASHGRGALERLLLGSATAQVLARSSVPVLVVR